MEKTKTLKIDIPEGYEIDKEKSTFENIVFKKVKTKFSKSWEEFCIRNTICNECYIDNSSEEQYIGEHGSRHPKVDLNFLPLKFGKPMLALMQLLTIREKEYTKGWEPDWEKTSAKHSIYSESNKMNCSIDFHCSRILSFPTKELRDEFYENWKDLIETAKPLL